MVFARRRLRTVFLVCIATLLLTAGYNVNSVVDSVRLEAREEEASPEDENQTLDDDNAGDDILHLDDSELVVEPLAEDNDGDVISHLDKGEFVVKALADKKYVDGIALQHKDDSVEKVPQKTLKNNADSNGNSPPKEGSPEFTAVVLLTYMRSGSSLTGDILQQHNDAFYVFEPFVRLQHIMEKQQPISFLNGTVRQYGSYNETDVKLSTLIGWLTCDFSKVYKESLQSGFLEYGKKTKTFYECSRLLWTSYQSVQSCLNNLRLECLDSKYRIIKTIRTPMKLMSSILNNIPGSKVVHLVRDPRATVESQTHRMVCPQRTGGLLGCAKRLCSTVREDTLVKASFIQRFPQRIHNVLYEDIITDPIQTSSLMYEFIGTEFLPDIKNYVLDLTRGGHSKGCKVCNTKWQNGQKQSAAPETHIESWKTKLGEKYIRTIESFCRDTINYYRYEFYQNGS